MAEQTTQTELRQRIDSMNRQASALEREAQTLRSEAAKLEQNYSSTVELLEQFKQRREGAFGGRR